MKSFSSLYTICICFLPFISSVVKGDLYDSFYDRFSCPDPVEFVAENPGYDIECVESSIPPWPICLFHNVTYFVDAAVSSASRCCDFDNLEECRCPLKYKEQWQDVMTEWCPKIAKCPVSEDGIKTALVTETWGQALMDKIEEASNMMDGPFDPFDDEDDYPFDDEDDGLDDEGEGEDGDEDD